VHSEISPGSLPHVHVIISWLHARGVQNASSGDGFGALSLAKGFAHL